MKIGVVTPSRGLIVAASMQYLLKELKDSGLEWEIRIPFTLGLPECFNNPIDNLMADKEITHFFLVEDDVAIPKGGLQKLIDLDADIAAINYPMPNGSGTITRFKEEILWCGTGCTLVKREVFEKIGYPYFRCDIAYNILEGGMFERTTIAYPDNGYGAHDIHFGIQATQKYGFVIKEVEGMIAQHIKILQMGQTGRNKGNHEFIVYDKIYKSNTLKEFTLLTN